MKIETTALTEIKRQTAWDDANQRVVTTVSLTASFEGEDSAQQLAVLSTAKETHLTLSDCPVRTYQHKAKKAPPASGTGKRARKAPETSPERPGAKSEASSDPFLMSKADAEKWVKDHPEWKPVDKA